VRYKIFFDESSSRLFRGGLSCFFFHIFLVVAFSAVVLIFVDTNFPPDDSFPWLKFFPIIENLSIVGEPRLSWVAFVALCDVGFYVLHLFWVSRGGKSGVKVSVSIKERVKIIFALLLCFGVVFFLSGLEWFFVFLDGSSLGRLDNLFVFFVSKVILFYVFILLIFTLRSK